MKIKNNKLPKREKTPLGEKLARLFFILAVLAGLVVALLLTV